MVQFKMEMNTPQSVLTANAQQFHNSTKNFFTSHLLNNKYTNPRTSLNNQMVTRHSTKISNLEA